MSSIALIIPAAGSGSRLQREIPKPYIRLAGRPVLEHTIGRFLELPGLTRIVVATSAEWVDEADSILGKVVPEWMDARCIEGGEERQDSIYRALNMTGDTDLIIVHDAVRPFVTLKQIQATCMAAEEAGAAILGVPAKDTIKKINDKRVIQDTPSRKYLWQAQTPQVFKREILTEAYNKAVEDGYTGTDDSSLVERLGYRVQMVEGGEANFKITYPLDLKLAQILLEEEQ